MFNFPKSTVSFVSIVSRLETAAAKATEFIKTQVMTQENKERAIVALKIVLLSLMVVLGSLAYMAISLATLALRGLEAIEPTEATEAQVTEPTEATEAEATEPTEAPEAQVTEASEAMVALTESFTDYASLTVKELKSLAKEMGVKLPRKAKKAEVVEALKNQGATELQGGTGFDA